MSTIKDLQISVVCSANSGTMPSASRGLARAWDSLGASKSQRSGAIPDGHEREPIRAAEYRAEKRPTASLVDDPRLARTTATRLHGLCDARLPDGSP
jgi:hypothetical protein